MIKWIPMEDWLRGCVYHDGRHGYVTLPTDKVRQIANYIQRTRQSTTDGLIDLNDYLESKCLNCDNAKACKEKHWEGCVYEPKYEKDCETCRQMRLIDADALEYSPLITSCGNGKYNTVKVLYERDIEDAPTVDAVRATMPWTDPEGSKRLLDEVSYEIGYSQGQKDTKRQGCKGCRHWVYKSNFGEDCEFDNLENCGYEPKDGR